MVNASYRKEVCELGYGVNDSGRIITEKGKLGIILDKGVELNYDSDNYG